MTARSDQELVHAAIDGTLADEEAARLRERLAEDAALRAEADRLKQLAGLVDSLGPSDLPESFSDRVMEAVAWSHPEPATWGGRIRAWLDQLSGRVRGHLQQERAGGGVVRWNTGSAGGGDIVAKKALWAVAGLAVVIILGVVYFNGTRTVEQGAQGTIGGAERYRGAQPSGVAVTEGDVQKFLQSDTFDRIIKDPHVLKLLENKDARGMLADNELAGVLAKDAVKNGLKDEATEAALRSRNLRALMADSEAAGALRSTALADVVADDAALKVVTGDKLQAALEDPGVQEALAKETVRQAFLNNELVDAALKDNRAALAKVPEFGALARNVKWRGFMDDKDTVAAMKSGRLQAMLADDAVVAAMKSGRLRAVLADDAVVAVMKSGRLQAMLADDAVVAMMKSGRLQAMLENEDFAASLKDQEWVDLLANSATLRASLQSSALDAELARKKR